ncbi:MAG: LLM class F420-dependent oxidoreductase [Myxococcales bacterium]|nr:LLM class F420-dependent oxidoreductase [Myxococcales bacterium]
MKLGLTLGYWMPDPWDPTDLVLEAERLGYDSVWTAEAYGSDCFSPLCWIGARTERIKLGTAIMQLSARTPACAAMTALTIDHLSGGRLILGIGASGPQVVEGWYGQPFPRPLERTREWMQLFRAMVAREAPVEFQGRHYQLPFPGGTGQGKPLKSIIKPLRKHIPVFIGAEGPKNIEQTTRIADGWLPLFMSPTRFDRFEDSLRHRAPDFEIAATVMCFPTDTVEEGLMRVKGILAFYIGGMGSKDDNFHKNLLGRLGFGDAAEEIQELFMADKRFEAMAAVPDALADEIALVGPRQHMRERLKQWKQSPVTTLNVTTRDVDTLRFLAEEVL